MPQRAKWIDVVGVRSIWDAMAQEQRKQLIGIALAEPALLEFVSRGVETEHDAGGGMMHQHKAAPSMIPRKASGEIRRSRHRTRYGAAMPGLPAFAAV